jgi:primosomal protein N' (replication factor Y) (superfamily II helicase)
MQYYEVLVTQEYTARESVFTYESNQQLQPLQFVIVPLQYKQATGIVVKNVPKPSFATKPISQTFPYILQASQRHLIRFLQSYYGATEAQALQLFMPSYLAKTVIQKDTAASTIALTDLPTLTAEQQAAIKILRDQPAETVIVHGDTGTGKTRLYIERTQDIVSGGKTVLILCPEIGLIPQVYTAFASVFGDAVVAYHSAMAGSKRTNAWHTLGLVLAPTKSWTYCYRRIARTSLQTRRRHPLPRHPRG